MKKNIVVDIDGVLADFEGYFCQQFGDENRDLLNLEDRYPNQSQSIRLFTASVQTYTNLKPIMLGWTIVRYLNSLKEYDIHIVSSRPEYCLSSTILWLKKHNISYMSLFVGHDKIRVIKKIYPLFAVDDLGQVASELALIGVPTILISQPWNRKFTGIFPRISEFSDFLSHFGRILDRSLYDTKTAINY